VESHLLWLTIGTFLAVALAGIGLSRLTGDTEAKRLRQRLREVSGSGKHATAGPDADPLDILQDSKFSGIPALDELLRRMAIARHTRRLLRQGDTKMRVGSFFMLVVVCAGVGGFAALVIGRAPLFAAPAAIFCGLIPYWWAKYRKTKRMHHFEKLFPDALDILTGALRSGLALTGAIQVVAEECGDPISKEFTILFEENRLGVDMRQALKNLADRVDSKELHLFVIAVLLQRETGGNLAEILDGTAAVIRERLRILGDVRALTAQSRLSASILAVLPVALAVFILTTAPDYMDTLLREKSGRYLLGGAALLQLVGYLIMRRIAAIKV
jgi:tight adherence protein B